MEKKKELLFVYEDLSFGGSTTSLEALLNAIDLQRYNVSLLIYRRNNIELLNRLPKGINVLTDAAIYGNSPIHKLIKGVKMLFTPSYHRAMKAKKHGERVCLNAFCKR